MRRHAKRLGSRLRGGGFLRAEDGGVALMVAMALPPLLLVSLGAIELQAVVTDRQKTQDVADAAALWGAQQLTVTRSGADERTVAFADAQLANVRANATVSVTAVALGPNTLKVTVDTVRPSFFMNLLPLGGFKTHVESIAEGASQTPLCVLAVGRSSGDDIYMRDQARLQGAECLVHSNMSVKADGTALIQGRQVEAGGTAWGPISPTAATGAPAIDDPFASLSYNFPSLCLLSLLNLDFATSGSLPPGVHSVNIDVKNGATLTLEPGEHYFCGDLDLKNNSRLVGDDVVLVFRGGAKLDWKDGADVSLNGRKSGKLAGFVLMQTRNATNPFEIDSDPISNITGTIYSPSNILQVQGSKRAASSSAWTVLAARGFVGRGGPNLVINANYGGTDVPVPGGVGNRAGVTRLR